MRHIVNGARGLNLLVRLNVDRLVMTGTLAAALIGAAWFGSL